MGPGPPLPDCCRFSASSDDMTLTSPSMDNSSAELLPSGDSPLNRRMTESLLASLSEHERAAILSVPAAQNPEDLRMFARCGGAPCGERRAADLSTDLRTGACVWGVSWTSFRWCSSCCSCRAGQGSGVGPEVCTSWVTDLSPPAQIWGHWAHGVPGASGAKPPGQTPPSCSGTEGRTYGCPAAPSSTEGLWWEWAPRAV